MSLLQMSFLGTVIILLIVVLRAVLINRLPKKTFLILWWIALIRLLVPFSIKSVTSIYSLLQSIYSDINPVRTAQTTTFRGYGTENRIHFDFECNMAGRSVTLFWIFCGFLYKMLSGISIFAAC